MLQRLVYYSRNAIPGTSGELERHIEQILETSRRNNEAVGVTGALMFNNGCFAQILEGPREAVEKTFERIQRDPRHSDVVLLDLSTVRNALLQSLVHGVRRRLTSGWPNLRAHR